jgi:hypothetical protein
LFADIVGVGINLQFLIVQTNPKHLSAESIMSTTFDQTCHFLQVALFIRERIRTYYGAKFGYGVKSHAVSYCMADNERISSLKIRRPAASGVSLCSAISIEVTNHLGLKSRT